MSTSIAAVIPVMLLTVVLLSCFVGCGFQTSGIPAPPYQKTVTGTGGLAAFWPLDETSGTTAHDISGNQFDGAYTAGPNVTAYNPALQSDKAPGTFTLNQSNIVPGDTVGGTGTALNPCAAFDGGFVRVPWQKALNDLSQFTIEAWVVPNWALADAQSNPSSRVVVASSSSGAFQGFAIYASTANLWSASLGNGSQNVIATTPNSQTIVQGSIFFLVVTFDGSTLTLWVNPADTTQPPSGQATTASNLVPVPSPIPLYIGMGAPDLDSQASSPTTRIWPFNGLIQDVAIYEVVLDNTTIQNHFLGGQAKVT
jgi:hypothetical protein